MSERPRPSGQRKPLEGGRRLASRRDDLIAQGVNPDDLTVPLAPEPTSERPGPLGLTRRDWRAAGAAAAIGALIAVLITIAFVQVATGVG
jgi:hypothetical protein